MKKVEVRRNSTSQRCGRNQESCNPRRRGRRCFLRIAHIKLYERLRSLSVLSKQSYRLSSRGWYSCLYRWNLTFIPFQSLSRILLADRIRTSTTLAAKVFACCRIPPNDSVLHLSSKKALTRIILKVFKTEQIYFYDVLDFSRSREPPSPRESAPHASHPPSLRMNPLS